MECQRTTPPIYPPMDVCTCYRIWVERSRDVNLPQLPTGLQQLGSGLDVTAIQLVGYQMSSEEIGDLYWQVYVLKRLTRPPPCGPERAWEIMEDIVSALKDHLMWRKVEQSGGGGEHESASTHPSHHCN